MTTTIKKFSTDSGIVGDSITNDSTLTLEGTATANSSVRVYDGGKLLGTTTADSSGTWSYTTGTLSNGTHSFTAATTSTSSQPSGFPNASTTGVPAGTSLSTVNGNFTSSYAGQIIDARDVSGTITVTHPDVIIRNCQAGNIFVTETGSNVTIEDSEIVGNPNWNSGITILGDNGTVRRCDIAGVERGIWLESDHSLVEGNYLHNLVNNTGTPDPHIDGIQIPGHGATVNDVIIRNNNLDLAKNVSASITMRDATNVDISNNYLSGGTYVIYFEGTTTGSDVTNNVFGEYYFGYIAGTAAASQTLSGNIFGGTAGSTGTASTNTDTSAPRAVTIDTFAPNAPTIAAPTTNANGGLNLAGTAEGNSLVQVYDGTTWIGSTIANQNGTWGFTSATLSPGSHNLTAKATDTAGNTGAASSVVTASTGTGQTPAPTSPAAPTIASFSNDSGTAGDRITNDNTLTLTGSAAAGSTVKVFDGTTQIGTATANGSGAWSHTTAALANGNHNLTATATTSSGTSSASSVLALKIDTTAPTTPTIATPTANANGNSLNVKGTAAEADSLVQVYDGTTWIGSTIANQNGTWGFASAKLATGSHNLTAKATDAAGNTSAASSVVTASTGQAPAPTPPGAPTIASFSNDSGTAGDKVTNDSTLTLTGSAAANSTVKVFDGTTQIGTATANSSGAWSHTTAALADGNHNLTATVIDPSGTSSASSVLALKIDTTAPTTPTIATPTANANGSSLNVKGTAAEADSLVQVYDGTTWIGSTIANQDGTWGFNSAKLATGSHNLTAKAIDAAGNTSAASSVVTAGTGAAADSFTVTGTTGDNRLAGTSGDNLFSGNGGSDTFEFAANFGRDLITDFGSGSSGHDVVEFSRTVFDDFADVLAHASQQGQDVVIDAGGGNTLTLKNTSVTTLDRTDFHFA